jgi:hypothetical protein
MGRFGRRTLWYRGLVLTSTCTKLGTRGGVATTNSTRFDAALPAIVDMTGPRVG